MVNTGDRFEAQHTLSAAEISTFARLAGDHNPLHHDPELARRTRFGGIIASGPQLSSLMMGLTATHFSEAAPQGAAVDGPVPGMLGLDFRFSFKRAVRAGEAIQMWWRVVAVHPKPSLGGELVFLAGQVIGADERPAVKAVGKLVLTRAL